MEKEEEVVVVVKEEVVEKERRNLSRRSVPSRRDYVTDVSAKSKDTNVRGTMNSSL